ncbi:MAG: SMC-Scp complex subunit ScpB [Candidatus Omnitrophica bacterium]|nr:SMC-Scp complex subunit ScpB [Candidatus Omnitrophota bacterium]
MAEDNVKSALEALIFASDKPLTIEQAKKVLGDIDSTQIRKVLEELKTDYEVHGRGIRITEVAGGFQMITSPVFASFLKKLFKERHTDRLSKPALETLAIIAYKQPLTRLEIESLRNVNVDGVMKSLADKNMVRVVGRKKIPGRPFVYGTTRQFLEYFGLKSLNELPKMEDFSSLVSQTTKESEVEEIAEEHKGQGIDQTMEEKHEPKEPASAN